MLIAITAFSAGQKYNSSVVTRHICDDLSTGKILDDGSLGDFYNDILTIFAAAVLLTAVFTVLSLLLSDISEINQGV